MYKYLISYDLGLPEYKQDYDKLIQKIKTYQYWAKPLKSVWFILSDSGPDVIRDELRQYLDSNDKLLVVEVAKNWATLRVDKNVTDWMKRNL